MKINFFIKKVNKKLNKASQTKKELNLNLNLKETGVY
jgi:hypothetical protein